MTNIVTLEVENEIGNLSTEDIRLFITQIIEKGFRGKFDIYNKIPISSICLKIMDIKRINTNEIYQP